MVGHVLPVDQQGWLICRVAKSVGCGRVIETHQKAIVLMGLDDSTHPRGSGISQPWGLVDARFSFANSLSIIRRFEPTVSAGDE